MDIIFISELKVKTKLGVPTWERMLPQTIILDIEIGYDLTKACNSDAIVAGFRERGEAQGKGYQTLINEALSTALGASNEAVTISTLRQVLREELHAA